jgi:hypothetical protein
MIASLLTDETLTLTNVPRLSDVSALSRILSNHGVDRSVAGKRIGQSAETGQTVALTARQIVDTCAPYELVSTMRASFWVIAPLLARMGEAQGLAARRLRHRHPPGRPASDGAGAPRRHHRPSRAATSSPARRRASRAPRSSSRRSRSAAPIPR